MSDYKVIFTYLSKTGAPCSQVQPGRTFSQLSNLSFARLYTSLNECSRLLPLFSHRRKTFSLVGDFCVSQVADDGRTWRSKAAQSLLGVRFFPSLLKVTDGRGAKGFSSQAQGVNSIESPQTFQQDFQKEFLY